MSSDGYRGRGRHQPDAEYERSRKGRRARRSRDWDDDSSSYPGGHNQEPPYPEPGYGGGYDGAGYDQGAGYTDPYGRTDPRGRTDYFGQPEGYPASDDYAGQGQYGGRDDYGYPGEDPYAAHDPYGRGNSYGGSDSYPGPYDNQHGYESQQPYNGDGAYGHPNGYGGQAGYPERGGYGDPYEGQAGYSFDDPGMHDGSGPMGEYAAGDGYVTPGDDDTGWHTMLGGATSGDEYERSSRRERSASRNQHPGAVQGAPARGSGKSGRGMDPNDDRHSAFFSGFAGNDDDHYGKQPRRRRGRGISAGTIALFVVIAVILGIGGAGYHFYSLYKSRHASYTGNGFGSVTVIVKPGDSADTIAPELLRLHVIAAIDPWAAYVATKPNLLKPGAYKLHMHMGSAQAWALLTNPKDQVTAKFTIPDGLENKAILPLLAKESGLPLSDFAKAIKQTSQLGLPSYANGNPEGYLWPATYNIVPGQTALQMLETAVKQFKKEMTSIGLPAAAAKAHFTPGQVITEASLLEAEVGPTYYKKVARTLDNRLIAGIPLQLDSTIAFITGKHIYNLSTSDMAVPSAYNTFKHTDLPPGPIDSPGLLAIEAVLHPASHNNSWIYFVTVNKQGLTMFTNSSSQFQTWSNLAKKNGV